MEPHVSLYRKFARHEVHVFKKDIVDKWQNPLEIWPFAYGDDGLGIASVCSSLYITHFFRRKLKLQHYARMASYAPVVGLSAIVTKVFHESYINGNILTFKCSICTEVKAALGQGLFSCGYPLVMAAIVSFFMADRLFTYPVPPVSSAPKEVFQMWQKLVKSNARVFIGICGTQMLASFFVTHAKIDNLAKLNLFSKKE